MSVMSVAAARPAPQTFRTRLRAAAAAGGLAVLLTGTLAGPLGTTPAVTSSLGAVGTSTRLAVTSVTSELHAVARAAADR